MRALPGYCCPQCRTFIGWQRALGLRWIAWSGWPCRGCGERLEWDQLRLLWTALLVVGLAWAALYVMSTRYDVRPRWAVLAVILLVNVVLALLRRVRPV